MKCCLGQKLGQALKTKKGTKGAVSISDCENRIRLRFRYSGQRYSLNIALDYCKANLPIAKNIASVIELDIQGGNLDQSLTKYKNLVRSRQNLPVLNTAQDIVVLFEEWTRSIRHKDCDINVDYYCVRNMMKRWGSFSINEMLTNLNSQKISSSTYNVRLSLLKSFVNWGVNRKYFQDNPLTEVCRKKKVRQTHPTRKPFTSEEIGRILHAFRTDEFCSKYSAYTHSHYYSFVYFLFATGCRPAEAIGLTVRKIDFKNRLVEINEALAKTLKGSHNAGRVRKETKNGKTRPIPITEELCKILHSLCGSKQEDDLVFASPRIGGSIDDNQFLKRVFKPILLSLNIEYRVLYTARHTYASTLIEQGVSPVTVAFLLGNNPETALKHYTHQIKLPENLPNVISE